MSLANFLLTRIEDDQQDDAIYMDFQKGSDHVDITLLLLELRAYPQSFVQWVSSYQRERIQLRTLTSYWNGVTT